MISLRLPYPISANRYWASRVMQVKGTQTWRAMTYVTPEAKAYKERVGWIARAQGIREPMLGRVELAYRLYPHRPLDWQRRMRRDPLTWDDTVGCIDLGNCEKVLSDALQGVVIENDRNFWKITGERMEPDEHGARLIVWVRHRAPRELPQVDLPVPSVQADEVAQ